MKKLTCVLSAVLVLTMLVVGMSVPVLAEDDVIYNGTWGILTWELNKTTGHLTISGSGQMNHLQDATEVSGSWRKSVIENKQSVYLSALIKTVTIEDGITTIGDYAFDGCYNLVNVEIPASVTSIGKSAFCRCKLESIEIPTHVVRIDDEAFSYCSKLTDVTIGNSVTYLGEAAFLNCTQLTSVVISEGITTLYPQTFQNCYSLKDVTLPNGLTTLGDKTFYSCYNMTEIDIPNSVTSIGSETFFGCSSLKKLEIPNSVTSIGNSSFSGCSNLESIAIPDSVTTFGTSMFSGCTWLETVTMGTGIVKIPDSMFENCEHLKNIDFGINVTAIGNYAFKGCTEISQLVIPNAVTSIGAESFYGCRGLTSVTIQENIQLIGTKAFEFCVGLKSIIYCGTEEEWNRVEIGDFWLDNIEDPQIHYHDTHNWDNGRITLLPTHTELGEKTFTCVCGVTQKEGIEKISDHTYSEWIEYDANQHKRECACGDIQYENHIYDDEKDIACNSCGYARTIPSDETQNGESNVDDATNESEKDSEKDTVTTDESAVSDVFGCNNVECNGSLFDLKSGCNSSAMIGRLSLLLLALGATGVCFKKKWD